MSEAVVDPAEVQPFALTHLTDAGGKTLKTLPKPNADDDPELAAAAVKQLSATKKQLRGFTADQATRLRRRCAINGDSRPPTSSSTISRIH
jgi:hypothetical protein